MTRYGNYKSQVTNYQGLPGSVFVLRDLEFEIGDRTSERQEKRRQHTRDAALLTLASRDHRCHKASAWPSHSPAVIAAIIFSIKSRRGQ